MTDQLERDLARMFADRAGQAEVPPVPPGLLDDATARAAGPGGRRRIIAAGVAAAAAVAAVAVPVGLALRDDPTPPPAEIPGGPQGIEVPYLLDGELHVGAGSLPTDGNALVAAGDGVLVGTSGEDSRSITWQRLDGDRLRPVPWLDGAWSPVVSYDGRLVAAPAPNGDGAALRVWDATSGELVDTVPLDRAPAPEDQWLHGFDRAGRLFWYDDGELRMRGADGAEATVRTGGRVLAAVAPGGLVLRAGAADEAVLAAVTDGGAVSDLAEVPVSTAGVWSDDGRLAFLPIGEARVMVVRPEAGTAAQPLPLLGDHAQPLGWSGDRVLVLAVDLEPERTRVLLVDPATGDAEEVLAADGGADLVLPAVGGTGAL
ncbi:MAG TPA: hypothetical protein VNT31_10635 [Nocardioides sp.]|nr:hypothetical protein [Nocardioides sp.]